MCTGLEHPSSALERLACGFFMPRPGSRPIWRRFACSIWTTPIPPTTSNDWVLSVREMLVRLVDIIPQSLSGEANQDSEPNLAINPVHPTDMVATAFTP